MKKPKKWWKILNKLMDYVLKAQALVLAAILVLGFIDPSCKTMGYLVTELLSATVLVMISTSICHSLALKELKETRGY